MPLFSWAWRHQKSRHSLDCDSRLSYQYECGVKPFQDSFFDFQSFAELPTRRIEYKNVDKWVFFPINIIRLIKFSGWLRFCWYTCIKTSWDFQIMLWRYLYKNFPHVKFLIKNLPLILMTKVDLWYYCFQFSW